MITSVRPKITISNRKWAHHHHRTIFTPLDASTETAGPVYGTTHGTRPGAPATYIKIFEASHTKEKVPNAMAMVVDWPWQNTVAGTKSANMQQTNQ